MPRSLRTRVKAEVGVVVKVEVVVKREVVVKTEKKVKPKSKSKSKSDLSDEPFPDFARPEPEELAIAVAALSMEHGVPERGECTMSVLDSLVRTILSQNTTDKTSRVAFAQLKEALPTYKHVLEAPSVEVEDCIRCGGLAEMKTSRVKVILSSILERYEEHCEDGEPSLEHLRQVPTSEVKAILNSFNGVGPKTVSCVLMFNMAREEFPVDTHVWHIAKKLNWVPQSCSRETCYEHLNVRVPGHLKYALHVLMVEHGKCCPKCAKGGRLQHKDRAVEVCPLAGGPKALRALVESFSTPSSALRRVKLDHCTIEGPVRGDGEAVMEMDRKRLRHLDLQSGIDGNAVAEAKE